MLQGPLTTRSVPDNPGSILTAVRDRMQRRVQPGNLACIGTDGE
jgi:hypothetical protein